MAKRSFVIGVGMLLLFVAPSVWAEATAPGELKERQKEMREDARERWEELKTNREAKREEVKENIQAKREETKAKIQNLRDQRKQKTVERIQMKLGDVNNRRTDHFLEILKRFSTILDKIESRTEKAKAVGKNVTSVETALASARAAITTAETAVSAQKAKTYQITVNSDTTAKNDVGVTTKQLQQDLQTVHDTVKAAGDAVQNVFKEIKAVVGTETGTKTATGSSATQ